MLRTNLDLDVLRTFVTGIEAGSFAKAAQQLGRSPSAISLQMRKLEERVGGPLLRKRGRGLVPTETGERLLGYALRMLALNDEALVALRGETLSGAVRFGLPQDLAETFLPSVLAQFAAAHDGVRVEVSVDRTALLQQALEAGRLDLALMWDRTAATPLARLPMTWIGKRSGFVRDPRRPLPLVVFEPPCLFREAGTAALDEAGIAWRVAVTSPALSGLWAAVAAGLGITLRTPHGMPGALRALNGKKAGLPPLPLLPLQLQMGAPATTQPVQRLRHLVEETVQREFGARRQPRSASRAGH